jgi:hypothetical protein
MTKLIVAYCNFAKAPKNEAQEQIPVAYFFKKYILIYKFS